MRREEECTQGEEECTQGEEECSKGVGVTTRNEEVYRYTKKEVYIQTEFKRECI
jgi:hypothetical protein